MSTTDKNIKIISDFRDRISNFPILSTVLNDEYFQSAQKQLANYEKDKGTLFNPIFLAYLWNPQKAISDLELLEKYLTALYNSGITEKMKSTIAGHLRSLDSNDTIFEISILNRFLESFSPDKIELFPQTHTDHDVEAKVFINQRWVYIEVSTIHDTQEDRDELTELLNSGGGVGKGKSIDIDKDRRRYIGKSMDKQKQFLPNTPNLLILGHAQTRIPMHEMTGPTDMTSVIDHVGGIMEFDYYSKYQTYKTGNLSCSLTEEEKSILTSLFNSSDYLPISLVSEK